MAQGQYAINISFHPMPSKTMMAAGIFDAVAMGKMLKKAVPSSALSCHSMHAQSEAGQGLSLLADGLQT
ncbi:MAG: hypothetical protein LBS94_04345 [Prevotellaceae bacterium]|jgi:hypothetical protein|nr:hypothetical protein [Prevotellaceae bacterium]